MAKFYGKEEKVVQLAHPWARLDDVIGAEHLLLGLVAGRGSSPVLRNAGLDLSEVRARVEAAVGKGIRGKAS